MYTCSTKTRQYEIHQRKYNFWLQKVVKNNLNIISKKFRGDTYNLFHEFISGALTRRIHIGWVTFLYNFLGESRNTARIPFLVTKTRQNSKKTLFFKNLEVDYITIPPLSLTTSHFGRIYSQKHIFL